MYRYLLLVCILLFSAGKGSAQLPLLRHYTVNDGMPSNNVYTVSQDSKGFIWLCTDWGISRFDGRHFENITSNDGLPDNDVFKGCEDPWQRYWLFCYNRVPAYIYNGKVYGPHNDSLCRWMERKGMRYTNAFMNERNEFCLAGKQTYVVGKNWVKPAEVGDTFKLPTTSYFYKGRTFFMDETHFFTKDGNGYMPIAGIEGGAFRATLLHQGHFYIVVLQDKGFKSPTKVFYDIDLDNLQKGVKEVQIPYAVFCFVPGKNGAVWCCTDNGVYAYNPAKKTVDKEDAVALQGVVTYSCFIDKQGSCWYATGNGLYLQSPDTTLVYNRNTGLSGDNVRRVGYMPGGKLLAGYDNGLINILDGDRVDSFRLSEMGHWNRSTYLLPIDQFNFFAGTDLGLHKVNVTTKRSSVINIYAQKSGSIRNNLFLFGFSGGVHGGYALYDMFTGNKLTLPQSGPVTPAIAVAIDLRGTCWLGTTDGLYYCREGRTGKLNKDSVLSHSRITSLNVLRGNQLVISTLTDGIFILDGDRVHPIDKRNGLISNICKKAYVDEKERIWVNTDKGLVRITLQASPGPFAFRLSAVEGLPQYMINDLALGGGKAYLATPKGIVVIDQERAGGSMPYRVYILSASLKDSVINYPQRITLQYKQNNVQVAYTAISYTEGAYVTYRYLLRGAGTDTVQTEAGSLNLGALSPGEYELMVWGAGKNNNWNKVPAVLYITVKPPFWREIWFVAGMACLLLALIVFMYKRRIRIIKKKEKERAGRKRVIAELEMQALRAQINPHFMFNALNAIQNFYNQHDELSANYYMASFARLIRQTLSYSKEHWIAIEQEMSMLKTYIELEQMRFKNAFTYEILVEPALQQAMIPTMLLQIYTENAINHGLRHLQGEGGKLIISCRHIADTIVCRVADNGVGFEKARELDSRPGDYKSMGLKMTASRIETLSALYGILITVTITDRHTLDENLQGTLIEITIHNNPRT